MGGVGRGRLPGAEALLHLTEKVIFDSGEVTAHVTHATPRGGAASGTDPAAPGPESLAVDAQGRHTKSKEKRRLASGDLAVLLDALIRRLGQGLAVPTSATPGEPSTTTAPVDDEGDEPAPLMPPDAGKVNFDELAKYCRRRTKLLLKRCLEQMTKAHASSDTSAPRTCAVQLAAVLAVLRALAGYARRPEWRNVEGGLIDCAALGGLLEKLTSLLAMPESGMLDRAVAAEGDDFEELHLALGLLVWVAWEADVAQELAARRAAQLRISPDVDTRTASMWTRAERDRSVAT